ncbi:MAG: DUF4982 domain-containing protein [Lachnospiraceae bacterium]|nr:DUF4982 domain-containing protein [Lachnospiraceae bacterium]
MECINIDEKWTLRKGFIDNIGDLESTPGVEVNLPHDAMIGTAVTPDAPGRYDSGYFAGDCGNYTKYVMIPEAWKDQSIGLKFDGAMMHINVSVNGAKVASHHYGYSCFYVDITNYVTLGEENRITVDYNTGIQPSARWYTGAGLYRSVSLCHGPKVHITNDGIYVYTKEVADGVAFLEAQVEICNETTSNRLVEVQLLIYPEESVGGNMSGEGVYDAPVASAKRVAQVNANSSEVIRQTIHLNNPKLWDAENPNLYRVVAIATDIGEYRTRFIKNEAIDEQHDSMVADAEAVLFGVRTITVDSVRGLRVNGKTVKLKGGCVHHDNGLIGAASLYESEARRVRKLKEVGFNAIRTTHNPPSAALIEACDRLGMYVMDEAFDAWGIAKRIGDYSNYFEYEWENDLAAYVKRDRVHPSVIIWSIGNEIPERGGLNNGYYMATRLAEKVRSLDATRPVSNGICSYWGGLDDYLAKGQDHSQNANEDASTQAWERRSEPFTNGLDIVGYNYLEEHYEKDHEMYPERVILGSENFPKEIGFRWPVVEAAPYIIGDFTWTAWDYIGEAGIGKTLYLDEGDPTLKMGPWGVMPPFTSVFPWRTANDADYDITGRLLPQGEYRSIVWGSKDTHVYSVHPDTYGKVELVGMWGFPYVVKNWNYAGYEGKPIEVVVFSAADEVELIINGKVIDRKPVNQERPVNYGDTMVNSVKFTTVYTPGTVQAVSYKDGVKVSRDILSTTKAAAKIVLVPEKTELKADGHDVAYVNIDVLDEDGNVVPDAAVELTAKVEGSGYLAGFGTGNPVTDEDYTNAETVSYRGHATAIIRSCNAEGGITISISSEFGTVSQVIDVVSK